MKKLIVLFLLLALSASGQVNVKVPGGGTLATEEYMKVYMDGWLKRLYDKPITDPVIDPDPGIELCPTTTTITNISNVGKTGLKATFSGNSPTTINWFVYKLTEPGLNLKSGSMTFSNTISLVWPGELAPGNYGLRIEAVNCTGSASSNFVIPDIITPTPCGSAPIINFISSVSRTSLTFNWTGLNVPEVIWNIQQNGTNVRSGSFVPNASQTITISYPTIPGGVYQLQLIGLTCANTNAPYAFAVSEPTNPVVSTRHIYMNFTGYGFDVNDPTGLASEWRERAEAFLNLSYQGVAFKGIDGIRVNIKWWEYEPNEGVYNDTKLIAAINWCIARGIRLSVCIMPWRKVNDNFFQDTENNRTATGDIWKPDPNTYMPSMSSASARAKLKTTARHMAQIMRQYPNNVDYISMVTAQTEEFQLVRVENPLTITGYGQRDLEAWANYAPGIPVQRPANNSDVSSIEAMMNTTNGRKWYEFQSNALRGFHAAFVQGVKEGGVRSCGMYAGAGAPSGVYDFSFKLNTLFSAGTADQPDIMYSSEGDAGSQGSKLMATDLNAGTFPGADLAIEFDPDDISVSQIRNPPYGTDLNGQWLYDYGKSFFLRGGKLLHFAMSFKPDKIPQLAESLYRLKTEYIDGNMGSPLPQGTPVVYPIPQYTGLQGYRYFWSVNGGGLNQQVKITIQ